MRRAVVGLLLALALAGCGGGDPPEDAAAKELGPLLDPGVGAGLAKVSSATGPMTTPLAARATAVRPAELEPWLETHGFQGGYSRVWTRGDGRLESEVVTALVYHFYAERNAADFVAFTVERIAASATYVPFDDPEVPGARGYRLTSRVAKATKFCAGEVFAVGRDAYVVTRCAPYPVPPAEVMPLAQRQHAYATSVSRR